MNPAADSLESPLGPRWIDAVLLCKSICVGDSEERVIPCEP